MFISSNSCKLHYSIQLLLLHWKNINKYKYIERGRVFSIYFLLLVIKFNYQGFASHS